MPKRKLQVLVMDEDDASTPSTSNIGERPRKVNDDDGRHCDYTRCGYSVPAKRELAHPDLVPLNEGHGDTPDQKPSMIPGVMLRNSEEDVDGGSFGDSSVIEEYKVDPGILTKTVAKMPVSRTARFYKMDHPKRGICLVFNQEIFDSKFSKRKGSEYDVSRIESTFARLNFRVIVRPNLNHSEVMDEIKTLSNPEMTEHGDSDCICIFILTHGLSNDFLMAKDAGYVLDRIWKPFTADKCPKLAGKPKLFFIQACRGSRLDEAVTLVEHFDNADDETDSPTASYTIPTHSDFLIAHSCQDGFSAVRNTEKGSWYVQCLCDVLDEFAESTDLMKMLTLTAQRVANDCSSYDKENGSQTIIVRKQVPSVMSTLTRDIYFLQRPDDDYQEKIMTQQSLGN